MSTPASADERTASVGEREHDHVGNDDGSETATGTEKGKRKRSRR
jgi:hypothetical protein